MMLNACTTLLTLLLAALYEAINWVLPTLLPYTQKKHPLRNPPSGLAGTAKKSRPDLIPRANCTRGHPPKVLVK